jgi:hypothetical protein
MIRANSEQVLQEWYAHWLDSRQVVFCASAGGMRVSMGTAIKMKRAGYKKGVQDIFIYEPRGEFHGMAVEVKLGSYPSQEQKAWKEALTAKGYFCLIVPAKLDYRAAQDWLIFYTEQYLLAKTQRSVNHV